MVDKAVGNVDISPAVLQFHPTLAHLNAINQLQQSSGIFSRIMMNSVMQSMHIPPKSEGIADKECAVDSRGNGSKSSAPEKQSTGQPQTRKKRRGVIEKRRRDRINSSLAELRRLVPAAFEKQGSQKLEKAEILQLAVQHLRLLASNGHNTPWLNPDQNATDYHSMGFRFCASDVDEFLSNEGIELHNPLRMRLSNHLQCFGAQRHSSYPSAPMHFPNMNLQSVPGLSTVSMGNGVKF